MPFYSRLARWRKIGAVLSQAMSYFAFAVLDVIAELLNVGGAYAVARTDSFSRCFGSRFVGGARNCCADHYEYGGYNGKSHCCPPTARASNDVAEVFVTLLHTEAFADASSAS